MKTKNIIAITLSTFLFPVTALAHTGHEITANFSTGFFHPVTGYDHLIAMLAVGVWAARIGGKALIMLPLAFCLTMVAGWFAAENGLQIAFVENVILLSVFVFGGLMFFGRGFNSSMATMLTAAFAFFHGFAHGAEMPVSGSDALYVSGFVAASAFLHGVGMLVGRLEVAKHFNVDIRR